MDNKEREQWRFLGAMLAMNGLLASGNRANIPELSFKIADDMLEQAAQNNGIVSITKRPNK